MYTCTESKSKKVHEIRFTMCRNWCSFLHWTELDHNMFSGYFVFFYLSFSNQQQKWIVKVMKINHSFHTVSRAYPYFHTKKNSLTIHGHNNSIRTDRKQNFSLYFRIYVSIVVIIYFTGNSSLQFPWKYVR